MFKTTPTFSKTNIMVSSTTLTSPIKDVAQIASLVPKDTNYHLFPRIVFEMNQNFCTQQTIKQLVELSVCKDKVIDLTLPFDYEFEGHNFSCSRFIIFNNEIVGIRLPVRPNSEKKVKYCRFSQGSPMLNKKQYPFGYFYLKFKNTKMALIFESEIKDNSQILVQHLEEGCEIFSIVSDLPHGVLKDQTKSIIQEFQKSYDSVVVFASLLCAPQEGLFYNGGSFISSNNVLFAKSLISVYQNSECITSVVALQSKSSRVGISKKDIPSVNVQYLMACNHQQSQEIKRSEQDSDVDFSKLHLYHLWYKFMVTHSCSPFIISTSKNEINQNIILHLQQLSKDITFTGKNDYYIGMSGKQILKNLLVIFNCQENNKVGYDLQVLKQTLQSNYIDISFMIGKHGFKRVMQQCSKFNKLCFYPGNQNELESIEKLKDQNKHLSFYIENGNIEKLRLNTQKLSIKQQPKKQQVIGELSPNAVVESQVPIHFLQEQSSISSAILDPALVENLFQINYLKQEDSIPKENTHLQVQQPQQDYKLQQCHICKKIFQSGNKLTRICNCKTVFCVDCLGLNLKTIQSFNFNYNCLVCLKKCICTSCWKNNNIYQLNTTSKNKCHLCAFNIASIPISKSLGITIQCSNNECKKQFCSGCIIQLQKKQFNHLSKGIAMKKFKNWKCYSCKGRCICQICVLRQEQAEYLNKLAIKEKECPQHFEKQMVIENLQKQIQKKKKQDKIEKQKIEKEKQQKTIKKQNMEVEQQQKQQHQKAQNSKHNQIHKGQQIQHRKREQKTQKQISKKEDIDKSSILPSNQKTQSKKQQPRVQTKYQYLKYNNRNDHKSYKKHKNPALYKDDLHNASSNLNKTSKQKDHSTNKQIPRAAFSNPNDVNDNNQPKVSGRKLQKNHNQRFSKGVQQSQGLLLINIESKAHKNYNF